MTMQVWRRMADVYVEVDLSPTEDVRADLSSTYALLLAEIIAGRHRGQLIVFAVRQAKCKSKLAVKMARFLINHVHDGLALVSIGKSARVMAEDLLTAEANVDLGRLKGGEWVGSDWKRLAEAASRLARKNVYITSLTDNILMDLRSACERLQRIHSLLNVLLVGSFAGLEEGHEYLRSLKLLAKEKDLTLVLITDIFDGETHSDSAIS